MGTLTWHKTGSVAVATEVILIREPLASRIDAHLSGLVNTLRRGKIFSAKAHFKTKRSDIKALRLGDDMSL